MGTTVGGMGNLSDSDRLKSKSNATNRPAATANAMTATDKSTQRRVCRLFNFCFPIVPFIPAAISIPAVRALATAMALRHALLLWIYISFEKWR